MFDKPPGLNVFVGGGNKITNVLFYMTAKIKSETNKKIPFFLLLKTHFLSGGLKKQWPCSVCIDIPENHLQCVFFISRSSCETSSRWCTWGSVYPRQYGANNPIYSH